ncbi:MAG: methyl-accepting chemotaxis protein, partial [Treponemataceae bacterium]|nr:methyl-accepting chemotaxis protein [Treponemataceae bacterium]
DSLVQQKTAGTINSLEVLRYARDLCTQLLAQYDEEEKRSRIITQLQEELGQLGMLSEKIRENAQQITGISDNMASSAEAGFNLSQDVQNKVSTLAEDIRTSLEDTNRLLNQSKKINEILEIMGDISSTTSVLSINASIVAARYGKQGKEFDVVAKEIRKLSEGTDKSLKDIASLLQEIQSSITSVSSTLQRVATEILAQKESILSVAGSLQGVTLAVEVIRSVTNLSKETAEAETESFKNIEQALKELTSCIGPEIPRLQLEHLQQSLEELLTLRTEVSV